ncbi:MAG: transporter substrate-binding domain-containing protein [Spirochaetales bacterium]|nr:transporter substrate-binding domain-containing protein [Spirochaetales bacterium]
MKKIYLIFLAFILFFSGCSKGTKEDTVTDTRNKTAEVKSETAITIGFFTAPPHIWMDESGQMKGALYELISDYLAPEMGMDFEWEKEPTTIPRQVETLQQKKNYIAALLTKSAERAEIAIYPDEPFFLSQSSIVVSTDNSLKKISSISDVSGMTVGYAEKAFISPFLNVDSVNFDLVGDPNFHEINFEKLLKKRIDAVYAPDKAGLLTIMKDMGLESQTKVLDLPEQPAGFYVVFTKDLANEAEKYNQAFKKLDGTRLYLQLLSKYLDTSKL